jgi:aquaporin Z
LVIFPAARESCRFLWIVGGEALSHFGTHLLHRGAGRRSDCCRGSFIRDCGGKVGFDVSGGFALNGYSAYSPGGYSLVACLVAEIVLTFMFLMIILGSTDRRAPKGFAPIAIALGLTVIHQVGIPVTNTSVNPARSTGPALFVGGWAVGQLWLFWVAPIVSAVLAGLVYHALLADEPEPQVAAGR